MRWPVSAVVSNKTVTKRSNHSLGLNSEQCAIVEELLTVLKPLQLANTFLHYEHNSSLSYILLVIHGLNGFLQPSNDDTFAIPQLIEKLHVCVKLRSQWSFKGLGSMSLDILAQALHPQFKQLKFLDDAQKGDVKEEIMH